METAATMIGRYCHKFEPNEAVIHEFLDGYSCLPEHHILSVCKMLESHRTDSTKSPDAGSA